MIGSAGRNAGKTELACSLIKKFRASRDVVGIKVTTIKRKDGTCPRGGRGCGVCSSLVGDYCITEETDARSRKDTSRLLAAGAERVFWLRVMKPRLAEGIAALSDIIGRDAISVCESNSLRTVVEPGLFIMVVARKPGRHKASAAAVREYADRTVLFDGEELDIDLNDIDLVDGEWILREHATVIVLAGGESTRMKQDKAMLPINGGPMIGRVCNQLRYHFDQILVSANDFGKYAFLGIDVIPDRVPGQGALMGIASALEASANDLNLVVACDIPEVDITFARRMLREAEDCDAVVPRTDEGFIEPLFAVYRKSVLGAMNDVLSAGERRVRAVFERCRVRYIDLPNAKRLKNLNTMEEYKRYLGHIDGMNSRR